MAIKMYENEAAFRVAHPIWIQGATEEVNITCGFYTAVQKCRESAIIRIAAASLYHLYINGCFVCLGPVRTAHGYHRMDAIDITSLLDQPINHIAIEVWNPYRHCFSLVKAPAFFQAEVETDNVVTAASGANSSFTAVRLNQRVRRIQNYSFQRAQAESYRLTPFDNLWRIGDFRYHRPEALMETDSIKLLPRGLPAHHYTLASIKKIIGGGTAEYSANPVVNRIRDACDQETEYYLNDNRQIFRYSPKSASGSLPHQLAHGRYIVLDTGAEKSGLIQLTISCTEPATLWLEWDELLTDGLASAARLGACSVIRLDLAPGTYDFKTFDIYSLRYLQMVCTQGSVNVHSAGILEYRYPLPTATTSGYDDPILEKIWQAALETFCQNASDIFMDCPHRERAGWLCDSFFIGRTEYALTGQSRMERQFLENFLLPEKFEFIPDGMLAMCYPSDHPDHKYIPNWAMWYVTQLADYVRRTGDQSIADAAKERIYSLLRFLGRYENEYSLLEKLDSWVFVEWSKANDFVQDVNFPTNMHYSAVLRTVGQLYCDTELIQKADRLRDTIRKMSFDGDFFIDNAIRDENGELHLTKNRTETCQYYAFFFEVGVPELHTELWKKLIADFGPRRTELGRWPEIHPSNAFIGNYLRLDLLVQHGLHNQFLSEAKDYFEYMADTTGTLWENNHSLASCNHGFASYFIYLLKQISN